jgi:hypothetical protein
MTAEDLLWTAVTICAVVAWGGLLLALRLARRYRELRDALIGAGILLRLREPAKELLSGSWLPPPGAPVPADLLAVTADGGTVSAADFAGDDVIVAFLASFCDSCRTAFPALCAALAAAPAEGPQPLVVLNGPPEGYEEFRGPLRSLARVVEDGDVKFAGMTIALGVRAFPAVLVIGGGQVRRAGLTADGAGLIAAG